MATRKNIAIQKRYFDKTHRHVTFAVGEYAYLSRWSMRAQPNWPSTLLVLLMWCAASRTFLTSWIFQLL